ncbi:HAD family hydrolase [Candidatus Vidania fulgoroideorum]
MYVLVVFDLDKTIISFDCENKFIYKLYKKNFLSKKCMKLNKIFYKNYKKGKLNINKYSKYISKVFNIVIKKNINIQFYLNYVKKNINKNLLKIIKLHKEYNHICLISTSSNEFLSKKISNILEIKYLISNKLEYKNGKFLGKTIGVPNLGYGKVINLRKWIINNNLKIKKIIFYSDSINDLPLFLESNIAYAVNPCKRFYKFCKNKQINILKTFSKY